MKPHPTPSSLANLANKKVLVVGLGTTGLSMVRYLHKQGAQLAVVDTRAEPPQKLALQALAPEIPCYFGNWPDTLLDNVEAIAISPGVPLTLPIVQQAKKQGLPVVGDIELFAQALPTTQTVIAITGSNGKTTVTTLVGELCRAAGRSTLVAGNIGLPVLDWLSNQLEKQLALPDFTAFWPEVIVLELSSFQLETTDSLAPTAAVVLNVSQDHLDRYAGMADYALAKARIYTKARYRFVNRDDVLSAGGVTADGSFGIGAPQNDTEWGFHTVDKIDWLCQGNQRLCSQERLSLVGQHNALNVLAALALTRAIGLPYQETVPTAQQFKGLPHRTTPIGHHREVLYVDDSKGTNVGAVIAALSGWPNKVILIAGGDAKGQDFLPLQQAVHDACRAVVVLGVDGPQIMASLQPSGVPITMVGTLEEAVYLAAEYAQPGDTVLLSPGCASFDMFRDYEHRAAVFAAAVAQLRSPTAQSASSPDTAAAL